MAAAGGAAFGGYRRSVIDRMRTVLQVLPEDEYQAWLREQAAE